MLVYLSNPDRTVLCLVINLSKSPKIFHLSNCRHVYQTKCHQVCFTSDLHLAPDQPTDFYKRVRRKECAKTSSLYEKG